MKFIHVTAIGKTEDGEFRSTKISLNIDGICALADVSPAQSEEAGYDIGCELVTFNMPTNRAMHIKETRGAVLKLIEMD